MIKLGSDKNTCFKLRAFWLKPCTLFIRTEQKSQITLFLLKFLCRKNCENIFDKFHVWPQIESIFLLVAWTFDIVALPLQRVGCNRWWVRGGDSPLSVTTGGTGWIATSGLSVNIKQWISPMQDLSDCWSRFATFFCFWLMWPFNLCFLCVFEAQILSLRLMDPPDPIWAA